MIASTIVLLLPQLLKLYRHIMKLPPPILCYHTIKQLKCHKILSHCYRTKLIQNTLIEFINMEKLGNREDINY